MRRTRIAFVVMPVLTFAVCVVLAGCAPGAAALRTATPLKTAAPLKTARVAKTAPAPKATPSPQDSPLVVGMDVSAWVPDIDWASAKADGARFVYIKATEGTYYQSPLFSGQYSGARSAGIVVGTYHFANPPTSSGTAQADYFAAHGGGHEAGTLPGALDIEDNPYGAKCYGMSSTALIDWIRAFLDEYHAKTGWWAVINTYTEWWKACVANTTDFAANDPLWLNNRGSSAGAIPGGWTYYTVWQKATSGVLPGDQDVMPSGLLAKLTT